MAFARNAQSHLDAVINRFASRESRWLFPRSAKSFVCSIHLMNTPPEKPCQLRVIRTLEPVEGTTAPAKPFAKNSNGDTKRMYASHGINVRRNLTRMRRPYRRGFVQNPSNAVAHTSTHTNLGFASRDLNNPKSGCVPIIRCDE